MRRDAFGPFATLSDQELSRLLVLVGAGIRLASVDRLRSESQPKNRFKHKNAITLNVRKIERFGVDSRRLRALGKVEGTLFTAMMLWDSLALDDRSIERIALDVSSAGLNPGHALDVAWLCQLLAHALPSSIGVVVLQPSPVTSFKWDWPLETAVRGRVGGLSPLSAGFSYGNFISVLDQPEKQGACDLLLVTGSLIEAARQALDVQLEASLVVVLEGGVGEWQEAQALLQVVRSRWRAGAIAVCSVAPIDQAPWLQRFVEELTHNRSIDQALRIASQSIARQLPLIVSDGQFVTLATLAETAKRIGQAITSNASSLRLQAPQLRESQFSLPMGGNFGNMYQAGFALIVNADRLEWARERGDASALIELKNDSERISGSEFVPARIDAGDLPLRQRDVSVQAPPASASEVVASYQDFDYPSKSIGRAAAPVALLAPRWVQANIYGGPRRLRVHRVAPNSTYVLEMFISPDKVGVLTAPGALNESLLGPSQSGHQLKIIFTPLWRIEEQQMHAPQVQRVYLPPGGNSERATFYFRTPGQLHATRARVVVLSGNRVLQTLILAPRETSSKHSAQLELKLESFVSADLGEQSVSPDFDASIVINNDAQGKIGLTVIAGEGVGFFEPEGVDIIVKNISTRLSTLNTSIGSTGENLGLDDPEIQKLLLFLSINGRSLYKAIFEQSALKDLVLPRKIQFVEAVPKGYFPIELAYEGRQPTFNAKLCPKAREALNDPGVHAGCENAASVDYHCPAALWGFSKCIERHTAADSGQHKFAQPKAASKVLKPFSSVLFGASQSVLKESIDPPSGIQAVVQNHYMQYVKAKGWKNWCEEVLAHSPSTLLLLPHSEQSDNTFNVPALEISGELYAIEGLEREYVVGPESRSPLVLVLGCSTGLTGVSFVNSISQFRKGGAAMTVGTVALITGRQTVRFVQRFLDSLRAAALQKMPFDEAYLQVKREMLAEGNPFVLSLVAYGDSGWELEV